MTKFFIKNFKLTNKCAACPKDKLSGYSLCPDHLAKARAYWQNWATERKAIGKCISCNRAGRRATREHHSRTMDDREQRCSFHAKLNTQKMVKWVVKHPSYSKECYARLCAIRDAGFCPTCHEHRKLPTGFSRCDVCRARKRSYGKR